MARIWIGKDAGGHHHQETVTLERPKASPGGILAQCITYLLLIA
jgi:hypothetical protein